MRAQFFPLDYILMVGIIAYFLFSTISGIVKIGIRFLWIMVRLAPVAPVPSRGAR